MSLLLLSLISSKSPGAGLMVYDLDDSNEHYLQIIDFSGLPVRIHQILGLSLAGNRLYALTPSTMLIFRIIAEGRGPIFVLEKTVCRPEWILGDYQQGDLHAVYASQKKKQVYLSFNTQCAIDIFDFDGNFLQRRNLWDIAPGLFTLPDQPTGNNFRFGEVRHIFETEQNELMLTTALINGTKDSAVISYDTGRMLVRKESQPINGGIIHKNTLYLCADREGEILGFPWPIIGENYISKPVERFQPTITDPKWEGSGQNIRGLTIYNDRLICGVGYFGKPASNQIPPRMVEFDLPSGKQIREHWLPSLPGLENPQIFSILPVSGALKQCFASPDLPKFYRGGEQITPTWIKQADKPVESERPLPREGLDTVEAKATPQDGLQSEAAKIKEDLAGKVSHESPETHVHEKDEEIAREMGEKPEIETAEDSPSAGKDAGTEDISEPTIIFEDVGLCFERAARKFLSFNKNLRSKKLFWALRDISFTVYKGETLGIIGRNGSGKSTLSMICSGVLAPDTGKVTVYGRSQLLALGVGFNVELSGRENVFISGSLLGLSKKEITARMDEIEEFADIGEFIDEPVRTYSAGMRSRLGFAVATAVKPDILILDEVMSTGDQAFREKAMKRMREMRGLARSVIVVSHNPRQLRKLSTRVLWLEKGRILMLGKPPEVLDAYNNFCESPAKWLKNHPELTREVAPREGVHG